MSKEFITIGICILSILASVVSAFITYRRIKQIDDLPEVAISAQEKEKYNAIAVELIKSGNDDEVKVKRYIINDDLNMINELLYSENFIN